MSFSQKRCTITPNFIHPNCSVNYFVMALWLGSQVRPDIKVPGDRKFFVWKRGTFMRKKKSFSSSFFNFIFTFFWNCLWMIFLIHPNNRLCYYHIQTSLVHIFFSVFYHENLYIFYLHMILICFLYIYYHHHTQDYYQIWITVKCRYEKAKCYTKWYRKKCNYR